MKKLEAYFLMLITLALITSFFTWVISSEAKRDSQWKAGAKTENWVVENILIKDYVGSGDGTKEDRLAVTYIIKHENREEYYLIPRPELSNNLTVGQKLIVTRHGAAMTSVRIGDNDTYDHGLEWSASFPFKPR